MVFDQTPEETAREDLAAHDRLQQEMFSRMSADSDIFSEIKRVKEMTKPDYMRIINRFNRHQKEV